MSNDIEYEWNVLINGKIEVIKDSLYRSLQSSMFISIWNESVHRCEASEEHLYGDARNFYFHHILEKRNYEQFALCKWNIVLLTWAWHDAYERNPDTVPYVRELKQSLINKLESNEYNYDNDAIWHTGEGLEAFHSIMGTAIKGK